MKSRLTAACLFLVGLIVSLHAASSGGPARPNILWVVTEDNSANYFGPYGDPLARTPHFDRVAKTGIVFDRAYSTSAVCAPTRASIITGMYAPSLGTQHMRSTVTMPAWMRYFPAYLREAGYYTTNRAKTDYNAAVLEGTWDQNGANAHYKNRQPGQPFFAVFNFTASHESSLHKRLPLVTDPAKVQVPAYLPDTPEVRADLAQYYDRVAEADRQIGDVLKELEAAGLADDTIIFYYSDHGGVLPRSKRFLYENGTHPSFAMSFPKKFQSLAPGKPGTRSKELVNWVDLAPTVLSIAGVKAPEYFQGRAIAGPARKPSPEFTYNFRDRMDERIDLCRAVTDGRWRYIRNYRPELPTMQHVTYLWNMSAMREWDRLRREGKLNAVQSSFFQPKPAEQLFDCSADPDNVRNLATEPAHRATLARFRAANRAHLLRIRDTGFMPEAILRELSGARSPVEFSRDDAAYPLARILDTIDRLQLAPTPATRDLQAALRDPLPTVRFWGAIAALRSPPSFSADLTPLLADPTPSVRLAAAFAVARHGNGDKAWPVFSALLGDDQPAEVKLEALNYLTNLPARPASLRPLIEAVAKAPSKAGENYPARAADFLLAP
ncbi:sulfatase-like hydrolase/transferase [Horticoccus sp. 23ND18S-11]|uniref:sulfatase-like hydrolase/transferase n=1 Tax=Horticoccus sp. 23ND18S-11 TaxID=3391832 RepID=UPI0039C96529